MTLWPDVMHQLAILLGTVLGAKSEAAVALFSTLQNARARREGLIAAAEVLFESEPHKLELLTAVLNVVSAAEKQRNDLAHGCYGTCTQIQDGILWIESKRVGAWNVSMLMNEGHFTGTEHAELAKKIFVYRLADIWAVEEEIGDANQTVFEFHCYLRWTPGRGAPTAEERYSQLCQRPRVATALRQIRSDKKNSQ